MRIRRPTALLTLTLLVLSSFAALAFAVPAAAETTISITTTNGYLVCPAYPLSGTWLGDTCTISGPLGITSDTTLSIGTGVTVTVSSTAGDGVDNGGTITNDGTLNASTSSAGSDAALYNDGTIQNSGTIIANDSGSTSVAGIDNYGAITNEGTVSASDSYVGGYGVTNQGTITNDGSLTSSNTIGNSGTITNNGMLDGIVTLNVAPAIGAGFINNDAAVINNYGTMTGAGISSPGIYNDGVINNHAAMNGTGTINTPFPADGIENDGVINNYGNTTAIGARYGLNNVNTTNEYCGATLTYSSLSGNAPVDACLGQVQTLEGTVNGMGLPHGTTTSLDSKLSAAMNSLSSGSDMTAANQLGAFVHEVNAQSGKQIPAADAQQLVSLAQAILTQLEPS